MPNPHVPINLKAVETAANRVTMAWDHPSPPISADFTYRVYINISASPPLPGPAVVETPRGSFVVSGYSDNVFIAVSSVDRNTGEESLQSAPVLVSIDHTASGMGGAVAKSKTDVPKFLKVTEDGSLLVAINTAGLATEAKQDVEIAALQDIRAAAGLDSFNEFWNFHVPAGMLTLVHTIAVPAGPGFFMTGLYVTGRFPAILELKLDALLVWRGRTNNVDSDKNVSFAGGPILAASGSTFEFSVRHDYASTLEFSGNLYGFKA